MLSNSHSPRATLSLTGKLFIYRHVKELVLMNAHFSVKLACLEYLNHHETIMTDYDRDVLAVAEAAGKNSVPVKDSLRTPYPHWNRSDACGVGS